MPTKSKFKIEYDKPFKESVDCFCIPVDIYKCKIYIANPQQSTKIEKLWGNDIDGGAMTRDYLKFDNTILISLYEPTLANLCHEIYHAVDMIMEFIGERHNGVSEHRAYLFGYIFNQALKNKKKLKLDV